MVESEEPATSWFFDLLSDSQVAHWISRPVNAWNERLDRWLLQRLPSVGAFDTGQNRRNPFLYGVGLIFVAGLSYGIYDAGRLLVGTAIAEWVAIGLGLAATLLRVMIALAIALVWTIPVGVAIGTNPRIARWLQPLVQIAASVPATALFPAMLLVLLNLPAGVNLAAVLLMLMGTQWYLLFNVIAGASAIPQDLKYTASLLHLNRWSRWRTLILPSLFPYIITGSITAGGGAWNASIVAEYIEFGGRTHFVTGIGAQIARATAAGNYPLLLAATLSMILAVVAINRLVWRRLYRIAEERFHME